MQLSDQEIVRRESLNAIREMGIDPYPHEEFKVNTYSGEIVENFKDDQPDAFQEVRLAGRIMSKRGKGKAMFAELQDSQGRIQIYLRRDDICPGEDKSLYNELIKRHIHLGDFIGISGFVFRTGVGEITVHVKSFTLLSKTLRTLPVVKTDSEGKVHHAFTDPELRFRMRYVDLTVNEGIRDIFITRSRTITAMRSFFDQRGWLEVETPILQTIHGGAAAKPFKTHHHTLDMPLYLRIANELHLKRLIVGGFDGVYEIGKMFRNEGMDRTHNPEFTSLEIYVAYKDYHWMMKMTENLLEEITRKVLGTTEVELADQTIDFKGPYPRISIYESIEKYTGIDISKMTEVQLRELCHKLHIGVEDNMGRGKLIDEIFGEKVEKNLIQPTFIIDYPIEMTPLAKKHRSEEGLVERFELFVNGKEIANAYTELNDPIDQKERLELQLELAKRGDEEAMAMDEDFIQALEYGMPPTSGLGIGIDRLVMILTGKKSIQEVLFFPQMRAKSSKE
nr:lysine--tRNA ligase [Saprospiraceae bacterium]